MILMLSSQPVRSSKKEMDTDMCIYSKDSLMPNTILHNIIEVKKRCGKERHAKLDTNAVVFMYNPAARVVSRFPCSNISII